MVHPLELANGGSMNTLSGCRVLIVDAHADTRLLYQTMFAAEGAIVHSAASGIDAVQILELQTLDTVICDIALPGLDGFALLRHLRTHNRIAARQTPIIAVTGLHRSAVSTNSSVFEFDAWLSKPVDLDVLVSQVLREITVNRTSYKRDRFNIHPLRRKLGHLVELRSAAQSGWARLPLTALK